MRAVVIGEYGAADVLRLMDVPDPKPCAHEVQVAVVAAGVNRADVYQRMGRYPPPGPRPVHEIPGLEFAGIVECAGDAVTSWKEGDRVFGLLAGGGYAERVVTDERLLLRIPDRLTHAEAAAIPEVFFTAWDALIHRGGLRAGDAVLIHAGGSGVGTAATQLARLLGAGRVVTTTRSSWKVARSLALGADRAVLVGDASFAKAVLDETEGRGADVILDFMGASYLQENLEAAAPEGRIVLISVQGGSDAEIPLWTVMRKHLHLVGTTLRSRPIEEKMRLTRELAHHVLPHIARGRLHPVIDRTFELADAAGAHEHVEQNRNFGKVVLTVTDADRGQGEPPPAD